MNFKIRRVEPISRYCMFYPHRWRRRRASFVAYKQMIILYSNTFPSSNHNVLLFTPHPCHSRSCPSVPLVVLQGWTELNVAKGDETSPLKCPPCWNALSKGKECHKTVLNIQEVFFYGERKTGKSLVVETVYYFLSPHRPLNWQLILTRTDYLSKPGWKWLKLSLFMKLM